MKNIFSCFIFTRNAVCVYKQSQVSFGIQSFCGKREINLVRNFIFLLFFYSSSDTRKNVSPYSLEESLSISKNRLFLHYFDFWYVGLYHCRMLGQVRFSLHHVPCCFCRSKSDSAPSSCIHAAPWIPEMLCPSCFVDLVMRKMMVQSKFNLNAQFNSYNFFNFRFACMWMTSLLLSTPAWMHWFSSQHQPKSRKQSDD